MEYNFPPRIKPILGLCMPKDAHTNEWYCISNQGLTFDENHRIDSRSDSCIIQIWQSIFLVELCSKYSSFGEIWLSRTETKVSPYISSVSRPTDPLNFQAKRANKPFIFFRPNITIIYIYDLVRQIDNDSNACRKQFDYFSFNHDNSYSSDVTAQCYYTGFLVDEQCADSIFQF